MGVPRDTSDWFGIIFIRNALNRRCALVNIPNIDKSRVASVKNTYDGWWEVSLYHNHRIIHEKGLYTDTEAIIGIVSRWVRQGIPPGGSPVGT